MLSRLNTKRTTAIQEGLQLLELWIKITLEEGIKILEKDRQRIEEIASRMVDHGMPGIARKLRGFELKNVENESWKSELIALLGELLYLCEIIKGNKLEHDNEIEDCLNFIGVNIKKEDIKNNQAPIIDEWLYLGKTIDQEEKLKVHKYWFFGNSSLRTCQLIDFQIGPFGKERYFQIGNYYDAMVHFYPAANPLRIVDLESRNIKSKNEAFVQATSITEFLDAYNSMHLKNPFLNSCLAILKNVKLINIASTWYLKDFTGECVKLHNTDEQMPSVFIFCSHPENKFIGEYRDKQLKLFSVCVQGKIVKI